MDLRGPIPTFVGLTSGAVHDIHFPDVAPLEEDSVVTLDRGYLDFERLYADHRLPAFFVIRAKRNLRFRRLSSSPVDKTTGVRVDQIIALMGTRSRYGTSANAVKTQVWVAIIVYLMVTKDLRQEIMAEPANQLNLFGC